MGDGRPPRAFCQRGGGDQGGVNPPRGADAAAAAEGVDPLADAMLVRQPMFRCGISNSMVGSDIPRWEMKSHGGKWWDVLLAYPASTPIHKGTHKGGGGQRPPPPLWRRPKAA